MDGHLQGNLLLGASDQMLPYSGADFVELLIADYLPVGVGFDVVGLELIIRTKTILVNKLHDGIQFLQLVLKRGAGE